MKKFIIGFLALLLWLGGCYTFGFIKGYYFNNVQTIEE
jgi:hypothetical protein